MISSHDISTLFKSTRREAQGLLPQLVRRLIFASCADTEIPQFEMAAGDDVRIHGWDGALTYNGNHPYIPTGTSVWEMGVSAEPQSKANEDYNKRTQGPSGVTRSSTKFVFVTPHVWAERRAWTESKRAEGVWEDVHTVDGSVLATWLERAPTVALWIADALGRRIQGLHSLDRYWDLAITNRYAPNITPDLIIGGRDNARDRFLEFLHSPSGAISLVGETIEEAAVFAAAICKQSFATEHRSRLLVMSEPTATEHLATLSLDHIVILTDPELYPTVRCAALQHVHFVLPEKRDARTSKATDSIDVGTLVRKATASALHEMGVREDEVDRIAADSKGSLHAVLWMIAQPERGALGWANGRAATELAPLVLAGQWTADDHPDHEVLSNLAQRDYAEIKQTLAEWSGPGKPLERRGTIWDWRAWGFAWARLAPSLQHDDIDRFLKIAKEVLGAADPALELPPEDRWLADIRGKTRSHSPALRQGLVQSLVLLAMNGNLLPGTDGQAAAHYFVESLLKGPRPAARWISIAPWLPDLAEAAPDAFLNALEQLTDDPGAVKDLFTEGGMFGSSPHTHVLWSLERLAWSPDHLGRVVLALARLAAVDPGGSLVNRPWRSLRMIMLPWHPATCATVKDRVKAVRLLFEHVEPTAWRCAASLLPRPHDIGEPFVRPRWRPWAKDTHEGVTARDYWAFQEILVDLLLEHAGRHGVRWTAILNAAPELYEKHPELGNKVVDAIRSIDPALFGREDAYILGEAARALVVHHQNMRESKWVMKGEALAKFTQLKNHLRPRDPRDQYRWLFTNWPSIPREFEISLDEQWVQLRALRAEAISAVFGEEDLEAILSWANEVEHPESLGAALAEREFPAERELQLLHACLELVGTPTKRPPLARLIYGYVFTKSKATNGEWRDQTLATVRETLGAPALAYFLQALPDGEVTWGLVENQDGEVQATYWREIGLHVLRLGECESAAPKLMAANRLFKVIDLIAMLVHGIKKNGPPNPEHDRLIALARSALDAKIDHRPEDEYAAASSSAHMIDELLNYLESRGVDRSELARWEWRWLPLICDGRRKLKAIQAELSESPELFVEVLKWVYRSRNAGTTEEEPRVEDQNRADSAYRLLEAWTRVPGLASDAQYHDKDGLGDGLGPISPAWTGRIEEATLMGWVERATELAARADRLEICNQRIGRQLAYAPGDSDGVWPCVEVRKVIERARNDDIEQGMVISTSNRRGFHAVGRDGAQETIMAKRFREWCEHVRLDSPRTGAVLRRLAEQYEGEAKREIEQGRLEEFHD